MKLSRPYRRPSGGWASREVDLTPLQRWAQRHLDRLIIAGAAVVVVIITLLVWWFFFRTAPHPVEVRSLSWGRAIEIEEFATIREEAWDTPPDARDIRSFSAIHHYEQQYAGQEHYPCGTSKTPRTCSRAKYVSVPVYRTKYDYEVDRWQFDHWMRVNGDHLDRPHWPITEGYTEPNPPSLGDHRFQPDETRWEQGYGVKLVDADGVTFPKAVDFATWDALRPGGQFLGHITTRGVLRGVDWSTQ